MNCLPGSGWEPVSRGYVQIANADGAGRNITINRYIVQKGLDRQLVLYWYQGRGRVVANEYMSRALLIRDAMFSNRTDGSLVRVIAPIRSADAADERSADDLAQAFVRSMFPMLGSYLP
jgi:EpsI family protein